MNVIFPPPPFLPWLVTGLIVIFGPAVLLKKGKWFIKTGILAIIAIMCFVLLFFFYRETTFSVTEKGIYSNTYGEFTIPWEEVDRAFLVSDLKESDYSPEIRTNGVALENISLGWFRLKNGKTARVMLQTPASCLVVIRDTEIYLFAPKDFESFIREVRGHIHVDTNEGEKS